MDQEHLSLNLWLCSERSKPRFDVTYVTREVFVADMASQTCRRRKKTSVVKNLVPDSTIMQVNGKKAFTYSWNLDDGIPGWNMFNVLVAHVAMLHLDTLELFFFVTQNFY